MVSNMSSTPNHPPTPWTHDLYVSMGLEFFEKEIPHPFKDRVRIGTPDNLITYHKITGELYARIKHFVFQMIDDPEATPADIIKITNRFVYLDDWVRARVPEERLAQWEDKVKKEIERKARMEKERGAALGTF